MLTQHTAQLLLCSTFLLAAGLNRQPLRHCALVALSVTSAGGALLPDLAAPPGLARSTAWTLAAVFAALVVALALLLSLDGLLLLRKEGLARPQAATFTAGLALAVIVGSVLTGVRSEKTPNPTTSALGLSAAYAASMFFWFLVLTKARGRVRTRRHADHVIVLGAGLDEGEVTPLLAGRLNRGEVVYRALVARGADPDFIVSGGQGPDEGRSEAEAMARYLVARGVPESRVRRENHSRNTDENLTYSAVLMKRVGAGSRRCVVVTSDFHVLRTALIMKKLGLRGSVVGARTGPVYWLTATAREFIAVIWYDRWAFLGLSALLLLPGLALFLPRQ